MVSAVNPNSSLNERPDAVQEGHCYFISRCDAFSLIIKQYAGSSSSDSRSISELNSWPSTNVLPSRRGNWIFNDEFKFASLEDDSLHRLLRRYRSKQSKNESEANFYRQEGLNHPALRLDQVLNHSLFRSFELSVFVSTGSLMPRLRILQHTSSVQSKKIRIQSPFALLEIKIDAIDTLWAGLIKHRTASGSVKFTPTLEVLDEAGITIFRLTGDRRVTEKKWSQWIKAIAK
ncbi:MAG: hypothetical protein AAFY98_12165 [Verrucomicrobiota bacterium]